jgi:hypothetical protein
MRKRRRKGGKPPLSIPQILAWADSHLARTGQWPGPERGHVLDNKNEKWQNIDQALARGYRGLPGGDSLARLLDRERGKRNIGDLPGLTEEQVLGWAQAHRARTGGWPTDKSGPVEGTDGEIWANIDLALRRGGRGFPGGDSVAQLLARGLGVRNLASVPRLSRRLILRWADAHKRRHGDWPRARGGPVDAAPGETWTAVDDALRYGRRGLPGGSSLARLLAERRGARNIKQLPPLSTGRILAWADAHRRRTGRWPKRTDGPIPGAPGETWMAVQTALQFGRRGLPGGSSLSRLLARRRGVRNHMALPPLTERRILRWADAHRRRAGGWPGQGPGPIPEAPGETWAGVDAALLQGHRGLPGGSSLARLLAARRGVRNPAAPPRLSVRDILAWADAHHGREGRWPTAKSGPVPEAPGETWMRVATALRGLPGGDSLVRLLRRHGRHVPERRGRPRKGRAADLPPAQEKPARRKPPRPRGM